MEPGLRLAGRYELVELLGHGAMGEVWKARDVRLDRGVAVKLMLSGPAEQPGSQAIARFEREAKALARMNHPHIATIHDALHSEHPRFLVLELLAGPDLKTLMAERPERLPVGQILTYGAQAAEGLAAAHARGIVHRDIKPGNLMLDDTGNVKVCDFGIARVTGATADLSATGVRLGTLAYMSPEQILAQEVTGKSDVYALGATLFQLLTGRHVFPGETLQEMFSQHITAPPPRPGDFRDGLPAGLDDYLPALLAKKLEDRPDAAAVAETLQKLARPPAPELPSPLTASRQAESPSAIGRTIRAFRAVADEPVASRPEEQLRSPFQGTRRVVVLGCTSGAGQTLTTLMVGHTFARYSGEPVIAVDANPGRRSLSHRTPSETAQTLSTFVARADRIGSIEAMRRFTSRAKSGLDVLGPAGTPPQALKARDYALAVRALDTFYSITFLDAAPAEISKILPHADQVALVVPASPDGPRALAMTFEWLDGHGFNDLRSNAVVVLNGVSRRSLQETEQAEAQARGRCRALIRVPWDARLNRDGASHHDVKSLSAPTRNAYLRLAGFIAGGFRTLPPRLRTPPD